MPIRTVVIDQQSGKAIYGVGGGITWDSTSEGEYHEILAKARLLEVRSTRVSIAGKLVIKEWRIFFT